MVNPPSSLPPTPLPSILSVSALTPSLHYHLPPLHLFLSQDRRRLGFPLGPDESARHAAAGRADRGRRRPLLASLRCLGRCGAFGTALTKCGAEIGDLSWISRRWETPPPCRADSVIGGAGLRSARAGRRRPDGAVFGDAAGGRPGPIRTGRPGTAPSAWTDYCCRPAPKSPC